MSEALRTPTPLSVIPVAGLPEVRPDADLAALIVEHVDLAAGDVVVVAQKIVSKAEGRLVAVEPSADPAAARRAVARAEARRVVADTPWVLITETPQGFVCANGGVDASNVADGSLVLLPEDPDASARRLRAALAAQTGLDVGVIVADTFGRPWRLGQTDVAIGAAGLSPVRDERGGVDREGRILKVTETAVADALAATADLVRRKNDGIPVVVVRGFEDVGGADGPGAAALVREATEDLFRRGAGMLALELIAMTEVAGDRGPRAGTAAEPVPDWVVERVLDLATADGAQARVLPGAQTLIAVEASDDLAAGVVAGLVIAALVDAGGVAEARRPGTGEPGQVVVEADWGATRARR